MQKRPPIRRVIDWGQGWEERKNCFYSMFKERKNKQYFIIIYSFDVRVKCFVK